MNFFVENLVKDKLPKPVVDWSYYLQANLIITLSLGSMETDLESEILFVCYNEVVYNRNGKIIILGAMTWLCYIANHTIVRCIIMSTTSCLINCSSRSLHGTVVKQLAL